MIDALGWVLFGWIIGVLTFIIYGAIRAVGSDGWDDSNITNWLRLLSHAVMHPEDFGKMWYVNPDGSPNNRPFWYISEDELETVVNTRPMEEQE